jgi:Protein of unknown function (DUF1579)
MNLHLVSCRLAVGGMLLLSSAALAQEKKELDREHQELARLAGEYTTESKFWLKPGDEPMMSKGTAKLTSVLQGLFLLEENAGTQFGQPIQGLRLYGYNNVTKCYEASWSYSMSPAIMKMTGTRKGEGKPIEWEGSFTDESGKKQTLYVITRLMDGNHFVVELFGKTDDGKKGPTLETTYARKK